MYVCFRRSLVGAFHDVNIGVEKVTLSSFESSISRFLLRFRNERNLNDTTTQQHWKLFGRTVKKKSFFGSSYFYRYLQCTYFIALFKNAESAMIKHSLVVFYYNK